MYKITCYLVPKRPEVKTKLFIDANSIKECLDILRKDHNIFEETVYKIELKDKKKDKFQQFDWTISEFNQRN